VLGELNGVQGEPIDQWADRGIFMILDDCDVIKRPKQLPAGRLFVAILGGRFGVWVL
jgi:hypothetical protein